MKTEKIVTKYHTNTYFIFTDTDAVVIDPGGNTDKIKEVLRQNGDKPLSVLITHGHFDHTLSVAEIAGGGKVYMSKKDEYLVTDGGHMAYRGVKTEKFEYTNIEDGDLINIGEIVFKVLATAGHTPGSVCFCLGDCIFSGDTLFFRSIGRTDLSGGDTDEINKSLKKLAALKGDYRVLPGHGQATTLENERQTNPYLGVLKNV